MAGSQTWANKPLFNTSGGSVSRLLVLQDGGGAGPWAVTWTLICLPHNMCD